MKNYCNPTGKKCQNAVKKVKISIEDRNFHIKTMGKAARENQLIREIVPLIS